jgi:hypothetical protein
MRRVTTFIGSSTKGQQVANALQRNLIDKMDVEVWSQGTFGLTEVTVEGLVKAGHYYDFAILVFTPDDEIKINGETWFSPRDNVLLEYGFFLGRLGRTRTFIVHESHAKLRLPSDINGVTCASYIESKNYTAALGPAAGKILDAVELELAREKGEEFIRQEQIRRLMHGGLQVVCRALSSPDTPENLKIRAFVFIKTGDELVCSHFWAPFPAKEVIGELRFKISDETQKQVVVVRAAVNKEAVGMAINFQPEQLANMEGEIEKDLCYVLAAPITAPNGEVVGTVDFDASSEQGKEILNSAVSRNVLFELGKLLHLVLIK